jgi:hypothetical protein
VTKAPKDVGASVRARLLHLARERGDDFQLLLTRYANERLLYRLTRSRHHGSCILKGATLFTLWTGHPHRATREMSSESDAIGYPTASQVGRRPGGSARSRDPYKLGTTLAPLVCGGRKRAATEGHAIGSGGQVGRSCDLDVTGDDPPRSAREGGSVACRLTPLTSLTPAWTLPSGYYI